VTEARRCETRGAGLVPDASPEGLCPRCLSNASKGRLRSALSYGHESPKNAVKESTRWGAVIASWVCLVPLAVILRASALVPQRSAAMWLLLEATIAGSALLAATFSVIGFRNRPWTLKVLGVTTFVVAVAVGLLEAFWFL
jgi:Na+-transporting NADH:ubiquinone oxidoreductase subunit NqrB